MDLTESTALGAFFSMCTIVFMIILFLVEAWAFMTTSMDTSVIMDTSSEDAQVIRINFNITMMDIPCEYASVDVRDVLGTNRLNITQNVEKWHLNEEGVKKMYVGRNKEQHDILVEEHPFDLEELHANGEHAIPVTAASFDEVLADAEFTFVNFYAPWCSWCQRLAPTWELFAEDVEQDNDLPVNIVKVDCVENRDLCTEQKIRSFPTLRFFINSVPNMPDYKGDRTREALMGHTKKLAKQYSHVKELPEGMLEQRLGRSYEQHTTMRAGCMLSGYLIVNMVPGNFHVMARSKYHDLDPTMTNLSHIVNHLSFGQPMRRSEVSVLSRVPNEMKQVSPLDGNVYVTDAFHQAYHHFIKVVQTQYTLGRKKVKTYQSLATSQITQCDEVDVPEARFSYAFSPMGVDVKESDRRWYDFITSILAIIGGTITIVGIIDALFYKILKKA
eukprot:CAMPEP_0117757558 /NCGR_PEP_ID=MMETSP0947-20121206/14810_1 /TAXON_ID=44440 /ORGANISM="Chattonella subsalsa, Strain CCMP2191" /LENGTH=443 /DNA_ID=CAMNT_0005577489 /DNA_START=32 /DNA_END=1363 /DNA_ORIENTATION=-